MRAGLLSTCMLLVAAASLGAVVDIPAHPQLLEFPQSSVKLPVVEGRRFELVSGPTVFAAPDPTLPLIEISLALRAGAFLDPGDKTGLSYLCASQMRRGGTDNLDAAAFDDRVDELGARLDSLSGSTRSGATLSTPTWAVREALDLFFEMLQSPRFQSDRLNSARSSLLASMSNRNVEPLDILEREWQWLVYGEDHFSTRPLTAASLAAIDDRDLRHFHARYWRPEWMILAVSGDFTSAELIADLEDRFSRWSPASTTTTPPAWPPRSPATSASPGLYHYELDTPQAKIIMGRRLPSRLGWTDRERFVLETLAEILGGQGAISRIAGRLRTAEGLVYRASANLSPGELWPGELRIFFETDSSTTARAIELALAELDRLRSEPVHPRELEVAQQSMTSRLRLSLDTSEEIAGHFAEDQLLGRPFDYRQRYLEAVTSVTVPEVRSAARKLLRPEDLIFLVVGSWEDIAGGAEPGASALESVVGHSRTRLPARDPLSLEPNQETSFMGTKAREGG